MSEVTPDDSLQDDLRAYAKECEGSIYIPAELARVVADRLDALESRVSPVTREALTDDQLIDLWWKTCEDEWAIPDWLMVKFGRAVLSVSPPAEVEWEYATKRVDGRLTNYPNEREALEMVSMFVGELTLWQRSLTFGPWVPVTPGEGTEHA